jgi:putative ABC transport system permease protein
MEPIRQRRSARARTGARPRRHVNFDIAPLADIYARDLRRELLLLFSAVGVLLLIACANLANLLPARSTSRRREFATRPPGARSRLVGLNITESVVIAVLGTAAGLLLARWGTSLPLSLAPPDIVTRPPDGLEAPGIVVRFAAMPVSIVLAGAPRRRTPARQTCTRKRKTARMATPGRRAMAGRRTLIAGEVAMAGAGRRPACSSIASRISSASTGDSRTMRCRRGSVAVARPVSGDARPRSITILSSGLRALPGVRSAGAVSVLPLVHESITKLVRYEGDGNYTADLERPIAIFRTVQGDYFGALGVPLVAGRFFRSPEGGPVGIISAGLARRLWPNDPVTAAIAVVRHGDLDTPLVTVVGVVGDVRTGALDREPMPAIYRPQGQAPSPVMTLVARSTIAASSLAPAIQAAIHALDGSLPVGAARTVNDIAAASISPRRFQLLLIGLFSVLALILAIVGVWGVTSYSVTLQRHDLGVRMALGASRRDVLAGVVGQTLRPVAIGLVAGLSMAAAAATLMRGLLYGIQPLDPAAFAITTGLLLGSASIGCYLPARKASDLDPVSVLRNE